MSKEVCEAINEVDKYLVDKYIDDNSEKFGRYVFTDDILKAYCPPNKKWENGRKLCDSDGLKLTSAFIALLKNFESADEKKLESDKLAEYAILWLSYKIKQNPTILFGIDDVYNVLIKNNNWFSEHSESIEKKKNMMEIYYSYLNNLYTLLKEICNTITKCNEDPSSTDECVKHANKCVELYQYFVKNGPKSRDCSLYCSILSNLKNDYEKFRKNCTENNLPELKLPNGVSICENLCEKKKQELEVEEPTAEDSGRVTNFINVLLNEISNLLTGRRKNPLGGKGQRDESDSTTNELVSSAKKLKGEKGDSIDIWRDQGLVGGSNWQYNALSGQSSGFKSLNGIRPKMKGLRSHVKGINGQAHGLKGERSEPLVIWGGQSGLRDRLPGLDGDINEQHNVLSNHSGFETVGGISPKMKGLRSHLKGTNGQTRGFKDPKGEFLGILGGQSGLRDSFPGLEGDFYDQYGGLDGFMDGTGGRTQGLKNQEGGYLGILGSQRYLRDGLQGLEGDSNGQYDLLIGHSELKGEGGMYPPMKGLHGYMKGISSRTQGLKGEGGDLYGQSDGLSGWTDVLPDLEGGLEDGSNEQHNILSNKSNGLEMTGGISLQIKILHDSMKGISGWAHGLSGSDGDDYSQSSELRGQNGGLKGEEGESLVTWGGQSGLRDRLPGLEGDLNDHYGRSNTRKQGLKGEEGGSLDIKHVIPHFIIESQSNSPISEDNVNIFRKTTTLISDSHLEHSKSDLNSETTQILDYVFNGNKIAYISVTFISILIILGISYKYLPREWRKKLKKIQSMKKITNLCDEKETEKEVTNTSIENN